MSSIVTTAINKCNLKQKKDFHAENIKLLVNKCEIGIITYS